MKDLTLKKEEKKDFILNIIKEKDSEQDTLKVIYADGGYNKLVENTQKNIKLAEDKMEEQAKTAVENIGHFKGKVVLDNIGLTLTIGTPATVVGLMYNSNLDICKDSPETILISAGVVTLVGVVPLLVKLFKDKVRLSEVKKIKYRDDNREKLESFTEHCNSLNDLNQKTIRNLTVTKNPFGIRNLDNLSQETLETIVENIDREEKIPFTYAKTVKIK